MAKRMTPMEQTVCAIGIGAALALTGCHEGGGMATSESAATTNSVGTNAPANAGTNAASGRW